MAADKNAKKVMDVSKPSEVKASPTSKPVIIGHKPIKDTSVVSETEGAVKVSVNKRLTPSEELTKEVSKQAEAAEAAVATKAVKEAPVPAPVEAPVEPEVPA